MVPVAGILFPVILMFLLEAARDVRNLLVNDPPEAMNCG